MHLRYYDEPWQNNAHTISILFVQNISILFLLSHTDLHDADTVTDDDASLIWILIYVVRTAYPHNLWSIALSTIYSSNKKFRLVLPYANWHSGLYPVTSRLNIWTPFNTATDINLNFIASSLHPLFLPLFMRCVVIRYHLPHLQLDENKSD